MCDQNAALHSAPAGSAPLARGRQTVARGRQTAFSDATQGLLRLVGHAPAIALVVSAKQIGVDVREVRLRSMKRRAGNGMRSRRAATTVAASGRDVPATEVSAAHGMTYSA